MVAEPVRLLCEPTRPRCDAVSANPGWQKSASGVWERRPDADGSGALAQQLIVRYVVLGHARRHLAEEYAFSERTVQAYLSGEYYRHYTHPVRDRLQAMGFALTRRSERRRRQALLATAVRHAERITALLADDPRPEARELVAELALLTAAARFDTGEEADDGRL